MNKIELIAEVSEISWLTKSNAEKVLDAFMKVITNTLGDGEKIRLIRFGTFLTATRKAITGRNPRTGEPIDISARIVPKFKAGKMLKEALLNLK